MNKFKKFRNRHGLSQEELAKLLGVTQAAISLLEAGKHRESKPVEMLFDKLRREYGLVKSS